MLSLVIHYCKLYLKSSRISTIELLTKIVNGKKSFIIDVRLCSISKLSGDVIMTLM